MKVKIMIEQEVECCCECICCHVNEMGGCWCEHPNGGKGDLFYFNTTEGIPKWCPADEKNQQEATNESDLVQQEPSED